MILMTAKYFGTNGVRGTFDFLNPQLALHLSQAIGIYLKRGKIVVARDARLTGEALMHAVIAGVQSVGCSVVDLGMVSSPTAELMIKKLSADGAIIITASHNPPEWNAIKVVDEKGISISKERGEKIEEMIGRIEQASWDKIKNKTEYGRATEDHITAIKSLVDVEKIKKKKIKLVLDCANNTPALIAPKLFRDLGCDIIAINENIDGRFPGRPSEPTKDNVKELVERVKKENADAGIAWDGDGDRVIFIDENCEYVVGDRVFALSALLKLSKKRGPIVTTVATSIAVEEIGKQFGCKTYYTKIGAPYLGEAMLAKNAVIGGEEVGGVIWPELSLAKDGFMTAAKIVEAIAEKPLSEWLKEIPYYYNEKTKISVNENEKTKIIQKIREHALQNKYRFIDIDGVKINFDDCWVIVRASGTENYVRIFAEAKEKEKAKSLVDRYKDLALSFLNT
jgi:phosphomannomutase/phosphoglucomutase